MKSSYNKHFASNGGFIIGVRAFSHPNDVYTLIHLKKGVLKPNIDRIKAGVFDSGYESVENYDYLERNKIEAFIKPSNYEIRKTRKYKKNIGNRANMNMRIF